MTRSIPFTPLPLVSSAKWQTVVGSFGLPLSLPDHATHYLTLDRRCKLCMRLFTPPGWSEGSPIVLLLHGLGGSDRSHYMRRLARELYARGYLIACPNRRGCGCGRGLSARLSHGGMTEDLLPVLTYLRERYPRSAVRAVGFSIGGNLLLKMLGELGERACFYLERGLAVCPPVDLYDTCRMLGLPEMSLYERYYVKGLRQLLGSAERAFPDEPRVILPPECTMMQFDALYTAAKWGYGSAEEYYTANSAMRFVDKIALPCKLLAAADDPYVRIQTIERLQPSRQVEVEVTARGGHMGFLGLSLRRPCLRWMDRYVLDWVR